MLKSQYIPEKLTKTVCCMQEESSGAQPLEDSSWMKQTHVVKRFEVYCNLYILLGLYVIEHSFVLRKPTLSRTLICLYTLVFEIYPFS